MRAMCFGIRHQFSDVSHMSTEQLSKWTQTRDEDESEEAKFVLLLDAREENEYLLSHLDGAVRVSPSATRQHISSLIEEHKNGTLKSKVVSVVCYCSLGYRSSQLARMVKEVDEALDIYNLEGSIFKWANEGRPLVDAAGEATKFVHPYNFVFGAVLNADLRKYN